MTDFDFPRLDRGAKHQQSLRIDSACELPVLAVMGPQAGPTLVVTAGVHGDEYEGVRAIYETFDELDPSQLRGALLAVPVMNPPAHRACTRTSPVDGANLARVFPGDANGTLSQRIAWHVAHRIIAHASFYLDLHSGGIRYRMPSMVGFDANDPRGRNAAEVFGAPCIWAHPVIEPGRTISFAHNRGIPFLYTEARGAGRIHRDDLCMMRNGIHNLLCHLAILDQPCVPAARPLRLKGAGNTDVGIAASASGFLISDAAVLDRVRAGQRLGRLTDLHGRTLEEYPAPCDGVVGLVREMPAVDAGDTLYLLAEEDA
ncbi:MAG: succinylglutamate desuccinylase/aspartoacylase family protein [Bryobacterales bacterium]|nr:succinylglutamate desuccinylase/aspartoacylase family protein [Bryobacterales bacterium]